MINGNNKGKKDKPLLNKIGLYTKSQLLKALAYLREEDSRRTPTLNFQADALNKIVETPYTYNILVKLATANEVLRTDHEAIIREVTRNGYALKQAFACKCGRCGAEYQHIKEKCETPNCGNPDLILPDYGQKQTAQAFLDSPNRDNKTPQINESLLRFMLSTDDYWLSFQGGDLERKFPSTVQVEDAVYMKVVWDETRGTIGDGKYFCPICTKNYPNEVWQKGDSCPRHPDIELKETAYVYAYGSEVKARFARNEIFHGIAHPWLPGFYGNSLIISGLRILMSITVMDQFNYDNYSTGKLAQILVFLGLSQDESEKLAQQVKYRTQEAETDPLTDGSVSNRLRTLYLGGGKDGVVAVPTIPDAEKMQSLDWWRLWREVVGSLYGVTPIFSGVVEQGKTGNNPRMQIDVNNNTTEFYQHKLEDVYNSFVFPKIGVTDWVYACNPVEEKDEAQDQAILTSKLNNIKLAIELGMDAELTDENEVKISGQPLTLEEKNQMQIEKFRQTQPQGNPVFEGQQPFKKENVFPAEKAGESWIVTKVKKNEEERK